MKDTPTSIATQFWAWLAPSAFLTAWLASRVPMPKRDLSATLATEVIPSYLKTCIPKPEVQLAYMLMSGAVAGVGFCVIDWVKRSHRTEPQRVWEVTFAGAVQVAVSVGIAICLVQGQFRVHPYFQHWSMLIWGVIGISLGLSWDRWSPPLRRLLAAIPSGVAWFAAVVVVACAMSGAFFTESSLAIAQSMVTVHLPYTMAEYVAPLNGRTPGINFFPQYVNLLGYVGALVFKVFGISIAAFTGTMVAFGVAQGLLVFWVLTRILNRSSIALPFFILWVGISFFSFEVTRYNFYGPMNYYANHPGRFFGPMALLAAIVGSSFRTTRRVTIVLGVFAGWVALNNLDFGGPAFLAASVTLGFASPSKDRSSTLFQFFGGAGLALLSVGALNWARTGTVSNFQDSLGFILSFGKYGFFSFPTPSIGLQWIVYFTAMASCATALLLLPHSDGRERSRGMALLYLGLWVLGTAGYYLSRSYAHLLQSYFPAWSLQVILLSIPHLRERAGTRLQVLPRVWASLAFAYFLLATLQVPQNLIQLEHVVNAAPSRLGIQEWVTEVASFSHPGEKVALIHPWGFWIAYESKTLNVAPFAQGGSYLLRSQVALLSRVLKEQGVRLVWGDIPDFIVEQLKSSGYRKKNEKTWILE